MADVITVRSFEDVSYLLNILFFNMNNLSRVYYDMFINPEPMDIDLQRYDEAGNLVTVTLPNRAKDVIQAYTGNGNPNGSQSAKVGALYIDLLTTNLYYKGSGSDFYGWNLVYSGNNSDYLKPNGNGSQLTNLNASAITSGTLAVNYGGTGSSTLNGILKGNGTNPVTTAEDGEDFMGPIATTGIICYYPVPDIPKGWLLCDGSAYSRLTYERLFNKIGVLYGTGNGSTTFNVPNLMGYFIRGWDEDRSIGVPQQGTVGGHTHTLVGNTGPGTPHRHERGTLDITGSATISGAFVKDGTGAISGSGSVINRDDILDSRGTNTFNFQASKGWKGHMTDESSHTHSLVGSIGNNAEGIENMVRNMPMYPIIKT